MYGTVERLKEIVQADDEQLLLFPAENQSREDRLNEILTEYLEAATDLINKDRKRDYEEEVDAGERDKVPPGIVHIAYRLATNMYIRAVWNQHAQGVQSDDFDTNSLTSNVFTEDIARDLLLYPAKPRFGIRRMRNRTELSAQA